MNSEELRRLFLDFFTQKKHLIVPSDSIIHKNDHSLMFTNAGMNQFKDIFLGHKDSKAKRMANSQKCLRVSGKHNDLEEVGIDTFHHTMFEMLGNWSFGDYFKEEAIAFAWEFLMQKLQIEAGRLYATYYEGDSQVKKDTECQKIWEKYLPASHIINGDKKDNFWEMGESGPCGPCSEIHIDIRSDDERGKTPGKNLVNKDHPLVIELWNLVFIEYNKTAKGELIKLTDKFIDTGMGFERLLMVMQNKTSSYDTDLFRPIIQKIESLSAHKYLAGDEKIDIAMRVIADHIRAVAFSIADNQLPSNTKAGYVIRRILRRAVRYGYTFLNLKQSFLHLIVEDLIQVMGEYYTELRVNKNLIRQIIQKEEEAFLKTLDNGIKLLNEIMDKSKKSGVATISGTAAFILYDTYGFPIDLTCLIAKENNFSVDIKKFEDEITQQKSRSKSRKNVLADDWINLASPKPTVFTGYDELTSEMKILRYRKINQGKKEFYQLVFDKTPFYGESGGQIGDTGFIKNEHEKIPILDTQKEMEQTLHISRQLPQNLTATYEGMVDIKKREQITLNHSVTHLLHYVLREKLGAHIEQKGSLVTERYLTFDFSHHTKLSTEEITAIENRVNQLIRQNIPLQEFRDFDKEKAQEMGAVALFGEKYTDKVRVVRFGSSIELCGGTHVKNTGQIGLFKITSSSAIAAGIRRIEAITNIKADAYIHQKLSILQTIKNQLKLSDDKLLQGVEQLINENKKLKKEITGYQKQELKHLKSSLIAKIQTHNQVKIIAEKLQTDTPQALKDLIFQLRREISPLVIILGNISNNKAQLYVAFSDDVIKQYSLHASDLIKVVAGYIQGGGGGQAFFANAGGSHTNGLDDAMKEALRTIKDTISS